VKALLATHARPCLAAVVVVLANAGCERPGALQITPYEMTLVPGQAGILRAVDADGVTPPNAVWKSENPAVAEIVTEGDEVQIRAAAPGRSCISARVLWEVATTCVTVLDTASVPAGDVRWAVWKSQVLSSARIADVIPARPLRPPPSVAMFVVETTYDVDWRDHIKQRVTVRGLDADGHERWRQYIADLAYEMSFADPHGGLILVLLDEPAGTTTVRRLDGTAGAEDWRYDSPGQVPSRCPQCPSPHAIRPDGTILLVEKMIDRKDWVITAFDLIGLDGASGKVTSRLPLPTSKTTSPEKVSVDLPTISPMVLEEDGTAAVAIGTFASDVVRQRKRADLKLLRISPGGTATWQMIREQEREGAWSAGYSARILTANRRGALLITWFERDPGLSHALATRTRVLEWALDVMIDAIDGQGNGYGVTAEGNVVRVDVTTGRQIGAAIHVGPKTRVLSGLPEGGIVVRDETGHVRHYSTDGTLLKEVQTPSDGQHPWKLAIIGNDFIETNGATILAFHVED